MRTWFGFGGALITALCALIAFITLGNTPEKIPLRVVDDEIRANQTPITSSEYTMQRPKQAELTGQKGIGTDWERYATKSSEIAKKAEKDSKPTGPSGTIPKKTEPRRPPPDYVTVGDFWKTKGVTTTEQKRETPVEDAVHATIRAFGNDVGSKIQTFVLTNAGQESKLGDFVGKRDEAGRVYVARLATAYDQLGEKIAQSKAPEVFATELQALANGYRAVADGLRVVQKSKEDADTYENMLTYNQEVEVFGKSFITFALLFKAQGVVFKEYEPGGIFSPPVSE
jgi:hypothetical protein